MRCAKGNAQRQALGDRTVHEPQLKFGCGAKESGQSRSDGRAEAVSEDVHLEGSSIAKPQEQAANIRLQSGGAGTRASKADE